MLQKCRLMTIGDRILTAAAVVISAAASFRHLEAEDAAEKLLKMRRKKRKKVRNVCVTV